MAELVVGTGARFPVADRGVMVGRRSDDGSFTPDIDLGDLEGGRTVSRRHARIYRQDGQWFLQVESATNPTTVGERTLAAGDQTALKDGDALRLGKVELTFRAGPEAPPPNPEATVIGGLDASAELRGEGRTFPLNAPEGRVLTLGRHSDDRTYHPDVDLGDLPSGRTVSRRHGLLYQRGGQWFLKVEAETTNPTVLDGNRLEHGQEVPLANGSQLQLGRVVVTFNQLARMQSVGPEIIELLVEPGPQVAVEAGHSEQLTVTVINHTNHVDWFRVVLEGIPDTWYKILLPDGTVGQPAQVRLFTTPAHGRPSPDAMAKLRIVFAPPKDCQSRAGVHPIAISATTQGEPQLTRVVTGQLTVAPFQDLSFALTPPQIRHPQGTFLVALHNHGNAPTTVVLGTRGEEIVYQWDRPQATQGVTLASCAPDQFKLSTRVKHRHWLGPEKTYTVGVTSRVGDQEESQRGELFCPPRIPLWLQNLYGRLFSILIPVLMIGAVLVAAFVFLRPPNIKTFQAQPASVIVGTPVALSWQVDRAASVSLDPSSGSAQLGVPEGNLTVNPTATTKYTLTARNQVGISSSQSVSVDVKPVPPSPKILSFIASPDHISKEGAEVQLTWQTEAVASVVISPTTEITNPTTSGQATVHPTTNNAQYELIATGTDSTQTVTKTVQIVINPPQIAAFSASALTVTQGGSVDLSWTAQNFSKLTITADQGEVLPGQKEYVVPTGISDLVVKPLANTEYTLTATNAGGSDVKKVQITVTPAQIVFFKAAPSSIAKGDSATLSWNVVGAAAVTLTPGGAVPPGETSTVVQPDKTTEYALTVTTADGKTLQQKVTVTVGLGPVKIDFFTAAPSTITKGQSATLTYSVQNAKHITIQGSDGKVVVNQDVSQPSMNSSVNVTPDNTTTYTLTVINDQGQTASPAVVTVAPPSPTPAPSPASASAAAGSGGGGGGGSGTPTPTPKH